MFPNLFTSLKSYNLNKFTKDLIAGIIVGIIALPLSIAFGIASGVSPEKGIFTAVIAGFLISLLGGSDVQIGGPTGAFIVIITGIIATHGIPGLIAATMMAGIFLVLMGVLKLGAAIKFIPFTITTGFTTGIAVIIFSTQIKDFLGLKMDEVPSEFLEKMIAYGKHIGTISLPTLGIGLLSLLIIILWGKIKVPIPGSLVAIIVTTVIVYFTKMNVETIGERFGQISSAFPKAALPAFSLDKIPSLIAPAFTIALLAAVESLLSAVVADGMIHKKHNPNMELIAQGAANIGSALFGGLPATGAIARTAANVKNGGTTPVAGIVHAITLLLIVLVCMPLIGTIPMATLAAILIIVSYNMSEWRVFVGLLKAPKSDIAVMLATFILTIFIDLVYGISIGLVAAAFLFLKRMSDVTNVNLLSDIDDKTEYISLKDGDTAVDGKMAKCTIPEGVAFLDINGVFFFGAVDKFIEKLDKLEKPPVALIIRMRSVPAMDISAAMSLKNLIERCEKENIALFIYGLRPQPMNVLTKYGLTEQLGEPYICTTLSQALDHVNKNLM